MTTPATPQFVVILHSMGIVLAESDVAPIIPGPALADGAWLADGTTPAGGPGFDVMHGLKDVSDIVDGDISQTSNQVLPTRKGTATVTHQNEDGKMSMLLGSDDLISKPIEIRMVYPGRPWVESVSVFNGKCSMVELGESVVTISMETP